MSALIVIFGSFLGFFGGIYAFAVLDMNLLVALGIWSVSGPLSVALLAVLRAYRALVTGHGNPHTA